MLVNQIINVEEDFGSGEVDEPVTLQQAKDYLRLTGFSPDDSGEQDFDFDDTLINSMIQEAREWVEKYTGQYIVPRSLSVVLLNQAGGMRLPGPVIGSVVYTNLEAEAITTLRVVGTTFPKLLSDWVGWGESPRTNDYNYSADYITAAYEVGYEVIPKWVKNAILAYVAWAFENRGDEQTGSPERAAAICRPHIKKQAWG